MTIRAIVGLAVLNLFFLGVGAGVLWGLRGWRWWTEFARLAGLAYLLGVACFQVVITLELVAGVHFGPPSVLVSGVVLVAGGLLLGRRKGRAWPRLRPPAWRLPTPTLLGALFIAALALYFEAFFRSDRLAELYDWDAWLNWTLKAKALFYFGGMEEWVFGGQGASAVVVTGYPPGFPALEAASFHAMGSADVVTLNLQFWFLTAGFVAAAAGLLAHRVRSEILLPVLLAMLVMPGLTGIPVPSGADRPLAFLVASAALLMLIWLEDRHSWQLASATLLLAGAFLTKREGLLLGACVVVAALAASWSERRWVWPRLACAAVVAFALSLPFRIWVSVEGFPSDAPEIGFRGLVEHADRALPSLWLAVRALFGYDFWLVLPAVAVAAAILAFLAGARRVAVFVLVFLGAAVAGNAWITWSFPSMAIDLDYAANPATRFMVTPALVVAVLTPLVLERAWSGSSRERPSPPPAPTAHAVKNTLLPWAIILVALVAYPASMLTGYSGFRLPGGPPSFPSAGECVVSPVAGEPVRVVFGYQDSYPTANVLRGRALAMGFQGTAVAQDGCGRLRVFVDDVHSIAVGEDVLEKARTMGLEATLELDPDD